MVSAVSAQNISVDVQPRTVVEGATFKITYTVQNEQASDIQIGKIEGCSDLIHGPGITTSFSQTNINGQVSQTMSYGYAYMFRAIKAGEYTIPAATLTINGKKVQSPTARLKVIPPDAAAQQQSQAQSQPFSYSGQQPIVQDENASFSKDDFFVTVSLSKSTAYVGEAVECSFKLYTRSENQAQVTEAPKFDGFLIEEASNSRPSGDYEHYNGKNYIAYPIGKYIIFPQKSGELTITAPQCQQLFTRTRRVRVGFGYAMVPDREEMMTTAPVTRTLNVKTLPQPQPASFTGAVGSFTLDSRLSQESFRTNEASSITYIITGTGNIKYIKAQEPTFPQDFELYTPSEDVRAHIAGNSVTGTYTAEYTFVPQSVGTFTIPAEEFSYFDPATGSYKTLSTEAYTIEVKKGVGSTTGNSTQQNEITQRATDILHIHSLGDNPTLSHDHAFHFNRAFYWLLWLAVIAITAIFLFSYKAYNKKQADVTGVKSSRAGKVAKQRLKLARSYMNQGKSEEFYAELLSALWGYISDRLSIPASQLSRSNISKELLDHGMKQEDIDRVLELIDDCEMARYTPQAMSGSLQDYYSKASDAMDSLTSVKPKK